jgi:pimeloyl-ACP methyl ester carboxylesterase
MKIALVVLLLILAILLGTAYWLYTPDKSAAALAVKYADPDTKFIEVDGDRLRVSDCGPRGAPAVILLHGFGSSLETWIPWTRVLCKTYRVVSFDLPGFGLTGPDPTGDYSDQRTVEILLGLMDRLGIARASLIGNSLGGKIAWNFVAAYPDRVNRLVLISPDGFASPGFEYDKPAQLPAMLKLLPYTLPEFLLRMNLAVAYANPKNLSQPVLDRYWDMMLATGNRRAMLARMQQVLLHDPAPILKTIQAPTLLLWGEQDGMIPFSNAQDYLRDMPHAELVALPGLGHVPFEEAPEKSLPPVLLFLSGSSPDLK